MFHSKVIDIYGKQSKITISATWEEKIWKHHKDIDVNKYLSVLHKFLKVVVRGLQQSDFRGKL